jgi:hypothetical protein
MSSLDFDLDSQMCHLEAEWRQAYESSVAARAELQALASQPKPSAAGVAEARERLDRAERFKARILAKIERLEENLLGNG